VLAICTIKTVKDCEVIVVGAGAMGSATAWWLARWGIDVVLVEQFEAGHQRGSSHGSTRIFRLAYPETIYVDMARRALPLWRELEADAGVELLATTGGIDYGDPTSLQLIVDALTHTRVPHEVVGPLEAAERWPGFVFDGPVVYQPDAGRISADTAVRTLQERAQISGARVRFEEPVRALIPEADNRVIVTTDVGRYRAQRAVVTAGAWVSHLLQGLIDLAALTVTREQVFHFPSRIDEVVWPSYIHHGHSFIYGLQGPGDEGIKVAEHHTGAVTVADERSFDIDEAGRQRVVRHVTRWMPGLDPNPTSATTCLYTNTPDETFIVERHGPIVVGSPCSGHGFKFVPLIGRQLAELARGH
jgi:sarcosine oxidase